MNGYANGHTPEGLNRAPEVEDLIDAVKSLIIPFIATADTAASLKHTGTLPLTPHGQPFNPLVDPLKPEDLVSRLALSLPQGEGLGRAGLLATIQQLLSHSVNTWDQGFLDKLYASTNAVGVVSELLLAALNTNLHVYQVSPALTVVEKHTARALARLFGLTGPRAGGFTCAGGSHSNLTSLVAARNALYPETKTQGSGAHDFVVFTSAHGHYSVEKAAITCGLGSRAVRTVAVDPATGAMLPAVLREEVVRAKGEGKTPFYVNATAGTTVLGSYDPFEEVADVCREFGLWMHVDASWGGAVVFSEGLRGKMRGVERADSVTVNPHKMLNVPVTCSFLLGPDTDVFRRANTLPAGYLFHGEDEEESGEKGCGKGLGETDGEAPEVWDLADITLQCGRKGDSLKLALAWIYYGAAGFERQIDGAFGTAAYMADVLSRREEFVLVSTNPPPCLQVCFYYAPGGKVDEDSGVNTRRTRKMVEALVRRGFMVDYAPGDRGSFFRVVVNCQTLRGTVDGLVKALEEVGREYEAAR
ncbi:PLP-dependent transferase [Coniochaeta ligniaria NRRL 30616]|uniref:PLP-dependent transferase n=1 Tax=Coniochaeta ligniaria NRRL 30616 TaxID=1408157 RepID=A0A1J7JB23_9PEZI|nr:PLP-dependent transferase [Coniochaeta ligniaria NRRL 30616]